MSSLIDIHEICDLYKTGTYQIKEIAELYNLKSRNVSSILKAQNIDLIPTSTIRYNKKRVNSSDYHGNI